MDDLGAPLALGLGLAGDGAHHRLVQVDVLDLDRGDLDAPRFGLHIERLLDVDVELLALGQQPVELVLAEHRAQRRLRELAGRDEEVRDLDDRLLRIDHAKVDHGVDLDRDVVAGDHVLRRDVEHHRAQLDAHHLLDDGPDHDQARPLHHPETPELEHHAALVLAQDPERPGDENGDEEQHAQDEIESHVQPLSMESGTTSSSRPSMAVTRTRSPDLSAALQRTRQVSPWMRAQASGAQSSSSSPVLPISSSRPLTTGRLRAFSIMPTAKNPTAAPAAATPSTSEKGPP